MNERILIAVDDSPASQRAIEYVERLFGGGGGDATFVLFTVVSPTPKSVHLPGVSGSLGPVPAGETHDPAIRELARHAEKEARPILERMMRSLEASGIAEERIENAWFVASSQTDLATEILQEADRLDCGTIVVGRHALPWYRELFHSHVGDRLSKSAHGHTVWVVETERRGAAHPQNRGPVASEA